MADGKRVRKLEDDGESAQAAAFSPDGKTIAAASTTIRLWDVATGKQVRKLEAHKPWVFALAFSPDGKTLASAGSDREIRLWEVATGQERRCFRGHRGDYFRVTSIAFSPNGKVLATGGADTTILLWGVTTPAMPVEAKGKELADKDLKAIWANLGGNDAKVAYEGMCRLIQRPSHAITFLTRNLRPVRLVNAIDVAEWIRELDSEKYGVRARATRELEQLDQLAEGPLKKVLEKQGSLEVCIRAKELLRRIQGAIPPPDRIRALRALEVLEHMNTPQARQLLERLGSGAKASQVSREALACIRRMKSVNRP